LFFMFLTHKTKQEVEPSLAYKLVAIDFNGQFLPTEDQVKEMDTLIDTISTHTKLQPLEISDLVCEFKELSVTHKCTSKYEITLAMRGYAETLTNPILSKSKIPFREFLAAHFAVFCKNN
jgi:RNAse (barnase) inhibitor barstar